MEEAVQAAQSGRLEYFDALPDGTLDRLLVQADEDGRSLLHHSAAAAALPTLNFLLGRGSDVNTNDDEVFASVCMCICVCDIRQAAHCLLSLPSVRERHGWTPLMSAVSAGHEAVVTTLLEAGAHVDARNSSNCTALHYACSKGRPEVAKLLLDKKATVNVADRNGGTPLSRAASKGHAPLVAMLLEKGANIEAVDTAGMTALHCAVAMGNKQAAVLLVARGADVNAKTKEEETVLEMAGEVAPLLAQVATAVVDGTLDDLELDL